VTTQATMPVEEFIERVEGIRRLASEAAEKLEAADVATEALLDEADQPGGPEFGRWNHAIKVELDGLLGSFPGRGTDYPDASYPAQKARDLIALVKASN
jgi:hypothetical protein